MENFLDNLHGFDIFMILFTIVLVWAMIREVKAPVKNKFALGFTGVSLLTFLFLDFLMVAGWFDMMPLWQLFPAP
jgi:hypothetical protein